MRERHVGERHGGVRRANSRGHAAIADVGVGEGEAGLAVVVLLRHHAVEPDDTAARVRDARLPEPIAEAPAAQVGAHDIEAEEGETGIVIDDRDGGRRLAFNLADEEALRIDRGETGGIGVARVPAFRRRPIERKRDVGGRHRADGQRRGHCDTFSSCGSA